MGAGRLEGRCRTVKRSLRHNAAAQTTTCPKEGEAHHAICILRRNAEAFVIVAALSDLNFRDLGGLSTTDGRRVRSGLVYRCEGPASFQDSHGSALRGLKLGMVCDLRSAAERTAAPNGWCDDQTRLLDFDMSQDLRARGADGWAALRADPSEQGARRAMTANYAAMPAALAPFMPALFGALAERRTPLLIHCTAGKDRTGVAIALLLLALGVARDEMLADYLSPTYSEQIGASARPSNTASSPPWASFRAWPRWTYS